jgi:hypothetical protein
MDVCCIQVCRYDETRHINYHPLCYSVGVLSGMPTGYRRGNHLGVCYLWTTQSRNCVMDVQALSVLSPVCAHSAVLLVMYFYSMRLIDKHAHTKNMPKSIKFQQAKISAGIWTCSGRQYLTAMETLYHHSETCMDVETCRQTLSFLHAPTPCRQTRLSLPPPGVLPGKGSSTSMGDTNGPRNAEFTSNPGAKQPFLKVITFQVPFHRNIKGA